MNRGAGPSGAVLRKTLLPDPDNAGVGSSARDIRIPDRLPPV